MSIVLDISIVIKRLWVNGKPYDKMYLTHSQLLASGVLEFQMTSKPNKKRGLSADSKPYSLTD